MTVKGHRPASDGAPLLAWIGSMVITKQEAAIIYAAACCKWYGARAKSVVQSKIRLLKEKGDLKGVEAWQLVADELSRKGLSELQRAPDMPDQPVAG
jgi:hypothetical protein